MLGALVKNQRGRLSPSRALTRLRPIAALAFVCAVALMAIAPRASAQQDERPSNERPVEPLPEATPPIPLERPAGGPVSPPSRLSSGLRLRAERFDFEGNTAFSTQTLRALLVPYTGRLLSTEDLLAAQDRVTRHYVDAGYATSGAVLPDQTPQQGVIQLRVVEGALGAIEVSGTNRFRPAYFERRLALSGRAPLHVGHLEQALQRIQRDPLVERVHARLLPTATRGESRLQLEIVEARQEDVRLAVANDRSPSVGEETGEIVLRAANLLGHRDELRVHGWLTNGLRDVEIAWALPVTRWDTRLETRVRVSRSKVVEFPFEPLDIESESLTISLGLRQPVLRTRRHTIELGLRGDWRRGNSTLDGDLFCFQPGVTDCTPSIAVLRVLADWRWRTPEHAFSLRNVVSWGTGWLGATTRPGNAPDGRFVAWLGQAQLTHRLPLDSLLVARMDVQLTDDPLLAFERIAVGGARTVRGYRPNQLVRDSGLDASLEWRVPVWTRPLGPAYLDLAPFVDVGHAWNERFDSDDHTIASLGLGAIVRPHERVEATVYWGGRLKGVDRIGSGLIDLGLHIRVTVDVW